MLTSYFSLQQEVARTVIPEVLEIPPAADQPATASPQFAITFFNNERDNLPKAKTLTWSEFQSHFSNHQTRATKTGAACWSPVSYKPGQRRSNEGVDSICMLVADIDDGVPFEALKTALRKYCHLAHSSFSHTTQTPKYRLIFPLAGSVSATEWPIIWERFNALLGENIDAATKDPARIFFVPCHPNDASDHFVSVGEGKFLDPHELPALPFDASVNKLSVSSSRCYTKAKIPGIEEIPPDPLGSEKQMHEVINRCSFVQWATAPATQPSVSEPLWMAMISNLCRFEGGDQAIHAGSCEYPKYDQEQTNGKIVRSREGSAPITCARIQSLGYSTCPSGGCKLPSGEVTKAPAGLGVWANGTGKSEEPKAKKIASSGMPEDVCEFLGRHFPAGLIYVNHSFYSYEDGYWPQRDELAEIKNAIARFYGRNAKQKTNNELLDLVKTFQARLEQAVTPNLNLLCLPNGTLDTQAGTLVEHSPEHHLRTRIDIEWSPVASCPRWLQFLDEIFAHDPDKAEKIAFVQTWFGYCLVPDNSQHKFVWMVGSGGNGKSVLLNILTRLVGTKNVSHAYMERIGDKFVRAELEGKLVNISPEMSADATIADGYLKSIVSGDEIEAERKYKPSFSFRPFVRMIGATNHLPRLLDLSEGFFRRAIVLTFNRQFGDADRDPQLEQKLLAELPGILAWAVAGLRILNEQGTFTIPQSSADALAKYKKDSDPVGNFVEECLERANKGGMQPVQVYEGYREWCRAYGFSPLNNIRFGHRLAELGFEKRKSNGREYWLVSAKEDNDFVWDHEGADTTLGMTKTRTASPNYKRRI